jgi:hypothetical protein
METTGSRNTATHGMSRLAASTLAAIFLGSLLVGSVSAAPPALASAQVDLAAARAATARFHDVRRAMADGYQLPPAGVPLHDCIASFDGTGAMGYHYINGDLIGKPLDPTKPQVLVYAPDADGQLQLVALEFVVFQGPGVEQPMLFDQMFMSTGAGNRYQIPAFYSLHVWLWNHNPSGMFAPFNPRVSCP